MPSESFIEDISEDETEDETDEDFRKLASLAPDCLNLGYIAGIQGRVTETALKDIVTRLAQLPVSEWLSTKELRYGCGLLAGWLPTQPAYQQE